MAHSSTTVDALLAPSSRHTNSLCLLLIYVLTLSLCAPFALRRAGAAAADNPISKKPATPVATRAGAPSSRWREGELLVRFREHVPVSKMNALLKANGAQWAGQLRGQSGIERLRLSSGADPGLVAAALRTSEVVAFAEPNYLITADQRAAAAADDSRLSEQWALTNIAAPQAWDLTTGSKQTVIAILDSGIDFTHPELSQNQWENSLDRANNRDDDHNGFNDDLHGWDFVTNSAGIFDEQGHGTALAGIIAAHGNNATGTTGVMWRASLMSLRVLDGAGTGDVASAVEALDYATLNGAQVINCSWGTDDDSSALREALRRAAERGVVVVTSAGNGSRALEAVPRYPASFDLPNLISVASTDNGDQLSAFSNWGSRPVTLAAPGMNILTTKMGGDYQAVNGTSAATALVTGVVGLVKTLRPWLGAERTREVIRRGARQLPTLSDKVASKGVVNAAGALGALDALPRNEGLEEIDGHNGGEHGSASGNSGNNRGNRAGDRPSRANNGDRNRDGREHTVEPLEPTRGVPGQGLPNLHELRGKQPNNPKAPHPVPSTRCAPRDPDCVRRKLSAIESQTDLLAWGLNLASMKQAFGDDSGLVSDSPFRLFWSQPASLAAPLPQPQTGRVNVALASNGGVASSSSTYSSNYPASATNNGDRKGVNWNNGGGWNDATANAYPDWLQIDFNGTKTIDEIDIFTAQDSIGSPVEPTETMTFNLYGVTGFEVQYWNGTAWATVPNGSVTGNNLVWRRLTFPSITTSKIRVSVNNALLSHSRIMEVEAYGTDALARANVALSSNGGVASASSTYSNAYPASAINNGDRQGLNWNNGGGWNDATANSYPDWLQVDFNGLKTIDEVDLFTIQDNVASPAEPTAAMTFAQYGIVDFDVQYWNGTAWVTVPGGTVTGNNKVWRKFIFTPLTTSKIRVLINNALNQHSRVIEVEAYGTPAGAAVSDFSVARLDPANRTGRGGVDLLSRNANWSLPILGLPGRAGLDLNLSLSYNSLVWTKDAQSNSIKFDADRGTPSPGFRLGFPVIQAPFYNPQTGKNAYLLITSSGAHVELRQVGTSNIYEAADSSYLQLKEESNGELTLRPTDGSKLTYHLYDGQYQCTEIKDRNGNYISVSYHSDGRINTITDTLARVILFNYDAYANLSKITQTWTVNGQQQTHEWATFGWSNLTIQTSFSSHLAIIGPQNNNVIPVLSSVGLDEGTYYKFRYNSWGQVERVTSYAADSQQSRLMLDTHALNYTSYTLDTSAGQTDCPRVSESRIWAEHWNIQNGVPTEVLIQYGFEPGVWGQAIMPDGTTHKEFYGTGWQKGLTTTTEIWSGGIKKKWTTTSWTQSDTSLPYEQNPRVVETNHYDSDGNRKRTVIQYNEYPEWGLPSRFIEYAADGTTEIRHTFTGYHMSQDYLDKRIIGLLRAVHVSDTFTWQSIIYYAYDAGGEQLIATPASTVQHDAAYDSAWQWRGNLTTITRYDVTDIDNPGKRAVTKLGYDTNGSLVFTRDPLNREAKISYDDSFSDGINTRNTFAYPTKRTPPLAAGENPVNFSATAQYNHDFGAVARTEGPVPAGHAQGAIQTFEYDSAGRLSRVNNLVNNAYRRWVYEPQGHVTAYSIVEAGAQETFSTTVFDGMGRVRASSGENPHSTGGYRGQYTQYDVMGRVFKQSNPTEMDQLWEPKGDDLAGWVWTEQAYDWQGRPTLTTNPDGTTKEISYGGCGCAGGEVVTMRDERGRRQRGTSDILGRSIKTEVLNRDQSAYSTTVSTYNALNQITTVKQYQGAETSGIYQESTLTYDGHGRLSTSHAPEQRGQNNQPLSASYIYNLDDTTNTVTDSRGASATYAYNSRRQVTNISYNAPTGITPAAPVSFTYDAAGNRTGMTDGLGSMSYQYDRLSRLASETRIFTGVGAFTLSYGYNLVGQLMSLTDPFGGSVSYTRDQTGRLKRMTGAGFAVSQFISDVKYRAWGGAKQITYGNTLALNLTYDSRLRVRRFESPGVLGAEYHYYADGRVQNAYDLLDGRFDRTFSYDQMGRLDRATAGSWLGPYDQIYIYDVWGNTTERANRHWTRDYYMSSVYVNNRNTAPWIQHDAEGRVTSYDTGHGKREYTYDAAGRTTQMMELDTTYSWWPNTSTTTRGMDGDGRLVMEATENRCSGCTNAPANPAYYVRSSVLGDQVMVTVNGQGEPLWTYVYAEGQLVASSWRRQQAGTWEWRHAAPSKTSLWISKTDFSTTGAVNRIELDPTGADVGTENPYQGGVPDEGGGGETLNSDLLSRFGDARDGFGGCIVEGIPAPCNITIGLLNQGYASLDPRAVPPAGGETVAGGRAIWIADDTPPTEISSGSQQNPVTGNYTAYLTLGITTRGRFQVVGGGTLSGLPALQTVTQKSLMPPEEVEAYRAGIETALKEKRCNDFVYALLNRVKANTNKPYDNILDVFKKVKFYYAYTGSRGGYAPFEHGERVALIPNTIKTEKFVSADRSAALIGITTGSVMGEVLHHVASEQYQVYYDADFARAYNEMRVNGEMGVPKDIERRFSSATEVEIGRASNYWHSSVDQHCKYPRE
jgi:YD repeat-containing protein